MYNVYSCYINYNRNRITSSINVDQSFAVGALTKGWLEPPVYIQDTSPAGNAWNWFQLESAAWGTPTTGAGFRSVTCTCM